MNPSLQGLLQRGLSILIVAASAAAGGLAFLMAYDDANALQDTQLMQVSAVLAAQPHLGPRARFLPRDGEEAETHFVVRPLGPGPLDPDPRIDLVLPATLPAGLQSLTAGGVSWRVAVARTGDGQPFGVAQRQTVRDEAARQSAAVAVLPMVILVPLLLLLVRVLLRRAFAPLQALSREMDALDGSRQGALAEQGVPREALPLVQAVNRLLVRLGLALEQQRRMVADAAHELRTPVAAVRVQADNLAYLALSPEGRQRLDILQSGLARIAELIEQLLQLARVQSGTAGVDSAVALDSVVRTVFEDMLALAEAQGVDLGCVCLDAVAIRGDPARVHALVRNAIENALRYSPPGGAVDVTVTSEHGTALLVVEDEGPGIAASDRERVFEPFVRLPGNAQPGHGLGLAIIRGAAQSLGGHASLDSRRDGRRGLNFTYRQKLA